MCYCIITHLLSQNVIKSCITMYKGKKRRHSRHWWRRILSRKYRRLLFITSTLILIVTAALFLLASMSSGRNELCFLLWCLIVGIILVPSIMIFRRKESEEVWPQTQHASVILSKSQEIETDLQQNPEASEHRIKEIPSKSINTQSQQTEPSEPS